jgi:8-oxo-dGTP diphosphatase
MRHATLCFLVEGVPPTRILLGYKKAGFGDGKFNGFGGKIEESETIEQAAVRELREEIGIEVQTNDLTRAGLLTFEFPAQPQWDHMVYVFLTHRWQGTPQESDEMEPIWFDVDDIPYHQMWADDSHWLPRVLTGETIKGWFRFKKDGETIGAYRLESWEDHQKSDIGEDQ